MLWSGTGAARAQLVASNAVMMFCHSTAAAAAASAVAMELPG